MWCFMNEEDGGAETRRMNMGIGVGSGTAEVHAANGISLDADITDGARKVGCAVLWCRASLYFDKNGEVYAGIVSLQCVVE